MKNFLFACLMSSPLFGFHAGIGLAMNTIDENFSSDIFTNQNRSGEDHYQTQVNRLAPVAILGHRFYCRRGWYWSVSAEWKYLNYRTPNVSSSLGQILPNATFSSINIFGPEIRRDFTSKTRLKSEVTLFVGLEKTVGQGLGYLGVGPVFIDASNRIYVSSVHTPNAVGDHLISTFVKSHRIIFGGAARASYQYYVTPRSFINIGYTYLQTGKHQFNNTVNAAILNGSSTAGPVTVFLDRTIGFTIQEFVFSVNLVL